MGGYAETISGGCVSVSKLCGVGSELDFASGKCGENAKPNKFGVCVCEAGFVQHLSEEYCAGYEIGIGIYGTD